MDAEQSRQSAPNVDGSGGRSRSADSRFGERLFRRDASGAPIAIDWPALKSSTGAAPPAVHRALRLLRRLALAAEERGGFEKRALLLCADDIAHAADEVVRAHECGTARPSHPSDDAEVREFVQRFERWPSRGEQPAEVRDALEAELQRAGAHDGDECVDAARFFMGKSIADLALPTNESIALASRVHVDFLNATAYAYYLPIVIAWVLTQRPVYEDGTGLLLRMCPVHSDVYAGRGGCFARLVRALGATVGPLRPDGTDWHREGFQSSLGCVGAVQREAFYDFLRFFLRRPDLYPDFDSLALAAVCYHFFWKDRANWAVES